MGICSNPACGKEHKRSKTGPCPNCYMKVYRQDPENRRKHHEAIQRYSARNPEKRRQWVKTWRQRVGLDIPELQELRAANKRLEWALALAEERARSNKSDQPSDDDGAE